MPICSFTCVLLLNFWCWITSLTQDLRRRPPHWYVRLPSFLPFLGLRLHCRRYSHIWLCWPAGISLPHLGTENGATTAHNMAQPSSSNISTKVGARLQAAAPQLQARTWTSSFQVVLREAGAMHYCMPSWLESSVEEGRQRRSFFSTWKDTWWFLPTSLN